MTDQARIRIAAALTALFLAGVSVAGLAARDHPSKAATAATQPARLTSAPAATRDGSARGEQRADERYEVDDLRSEVDREREDGE